MGPSPAASSMPLLTTEPWYYLDAGYADRQPPLPDGLYPFNFDVTPDGFFAYWAAQGVTTVPRIGRVSCGKSSTAICRCST